MPQITATDNSARAAATYSTEKNTTANDMLGKDAFLKLLVTQLRYQDPLSPMDDREFVAQMAQFSTLEQMQNMNGQMLHLGALAMLGQEVLILPENGGLPAAGIVDRVVTLNGSVQVAVNGQLYPVEWVKAVQPAAPADIEDGNGEDQDGSQTL